MRHLFGTDGVRGKANLHPMTPEIALALGQAIARYSVQHTSQRRIVIGKDTRRSSYMIEQAMAAGLCSMGFDAIFLGPMPTPGVAFLTRAMRAAAGVMISASHNPFDDNGIKFFDGDGFKLTDEVELQLEAMVAQGITDDDRPTGGAIGKAFRVDDALGRYVEYAKRTFPSNLSLQGLKIVVDCAHGAAYKIAPTVLWELGAEVIKLGVEPNGININDGVGALHPETMAQHVLQHGAHMGIALDGDADRLILCDEKGQVVDGDQVIALCALEMQQQDLLHDQTVVGTIMTNLGMEVFLKHHGIHLERTAVGDRYIIEAMRKHKWRLGGEPSGHIIFSKHATTGDGLIAALQVLATVVKQKTSLSQIIHQVPLYPQVAEKIAVSQKIPLEDLASLMTTLKQQEERLGDRGRVVMRYSGTEPVLRIMVEGESQSLVEDVLQVLSRSAHEALRI